MTTGSLNREHAGEKIRRFLEGRIARLLECQPSELPHFKLGTLVHFLFLLKGDSEEVGGFHSSMHALLEICGHEIVWEIEKEEPKEVKTPKEVIN